MAATVHLDATHMVIRGMFTMTQFYFLVSVIISSVTHELFRLMLLFPDLQGFWGIFVNDFSPVHTSQWFHLRGEDHWRRATGACCLHWQSSYSPGAKGCRDWQQEAGQGTQQEKGGRDMGGAPTTSATLIPRQVSSFISNALFHCSVLVTSFLGAKDSTNNTLAPYFWSLVSERFQ